MTLYELKPRFQDLLHPVVAALARFGATPNVVTVLAALVSIVIGAVTAWRAEWRPIFLVTPIWLLIRMALNAIDGMLAREFQLKTVVGAYLNEIGDVVSDAALYVPFAFVLPAGASGVGLVIVLSIMTEFAGALGVVVGASRRYDGPMGKSDRALVFGALGLWIGSSAPIPAWLGWLMPTLAVLLALTVVNRVRAGVSEAEKAGSQPC